MEDKELTQIQMHLVANQLRSKIDELPNSRERSLALTKLDECLMWLDKAVEK